MGSLLLEASSRQASEKGKAIRASGSIPAVYYGSGKPTHSLQINYQQFQKVFDKAGENTIIELSLDGKKYPVLIYDIQMDPLSDRVSHVDFIHVDMDKEVTTSVKLNFIGTSPAVKNLGGILDAQKHELKIKCLPKDLIHAIDVDVSSIADFRTTIHVKDVKVPSTIKLLDKPDDAVVTVVPPRAEEETKPAATAEGAVPAEGAAAPAEGGVPAAGAQGAVATPAAAQPAKEAKK